jgi:hypothetical protein
MPVDDIRWCSFEDQELQRAYDAYEHDLRTAAIASSAACVASSSAFLVVVALAVFDSHHDVLAPGENS